MIFRAAKPRFMQAHSDCIRVRVQRLHRLFIFMFFSAPWRLCGEIKTSYPTRLFGVSYPYQSGRLDGRRRGWIPDPRPRRVCGEINY